jgi:hypothetical protein
MNPERSLRFAVKPSMTRRAFSSLIATAPGTLDFLTPAR